MTLRERMLFLLEHKKKSKRCTPNDTRVKCRPRRWGYGGGIGFRGVGGPPAGNGGNGGNGGGNGGGMGGMGGGGGD